MVKIMIELTKNNRLIKIISIISFLLVILALSIILVTPSATGYEISIYDAFPWYFWVFIIFSIAIGQIIIIFNIYTKNNKIWIISLIIFLVAGTILISMPYIRGYVTYGTGDHLTHVGAAKDIIYSGSIKPNDFYPSIHILAAVIGLIANINVIDVSTFLPHLFPFMFFMGFIILSRFFLEKHNEFLLSILFLSSILFFASSSSYLSQYSQTFLLLPLILFLYYKRSVIGNTMTFNILFFIFSISLVFYHPIIFLLLLIILSVSALITIIVSKNKKHDKIVTRTDPIKTKVIMPVILLTVIYITWYFSFSSMLRNFQRIFSSIFYGIGESTVSAQISMVSTYNVSFLDILKIVFFQYGIWIIISILSVFSILYLFYHLLWKKNKQVLHYKFLFLSSSIFLLGCLSFLGFFFDVIVGWGRFYQYVIFFSLLLVPIALTYSPKTRIKSLNKTISYRKLTIIFIIIFLVLYLSVFTFYRSPITVETSLAVSSKECVGFTWFIENRNITYLTDELGISQFRFYGALHNNNSVSKNLRYLNAAPPDHFGYNNSITLGSQYDMPNYFILSTLGRIVYPSLYPNYKDYWRFTEKDFQMLLDDSTVSSVYSNSGFDVFFITPK